MTEPIIEPTLPEPDLITPEQIKDIVEEIIEPTPVDITLTTDEAVAFLNI